MFLSLIITFSITVVALFHNRQYSGYLVFSHLNSTRKGGGRLKTSPQKVADDMYNHIVDDKYAKALVLGNKWRLDPRFAGHMLFWLNYAFAYIMAKPGITRQTATPVYLCRKFARRDSNHTTSLEGNFWYTCQGIAKHKGNLKAAIKMLRLAQQMFPDNHKEMTHKLLAEYQRDLLTQKAKR